MTSSGEVLKIVPTRNTLPGSCAGAASGQTVAAVPQAMNSRRFIYDPHKPALKQAEYPILNDLCMRAQANVALRWLVRAAIAPSAEREKVAKSGPLCPANGRQSVSLQDGPASKPH
jgi:hypothetical protein